MLIKPCGFQVIVEVEEVEKKSEGGIIINTRKELEREQDGHDVGCVVSFGPQCFKGFADCEGPTDWCESLKVGSVVEFRRYDGKIPRHDSDGRYRCINDSDILMVIEQ